MDGHTNVFGDLLVLFPLLNFLASIIRRTASWSEWKRAPSADGTMFIAEVDMVTSAKQPKVKQQAAAATTTKKDTNSQ